MSQEANPLVAQRIEQLRPKEMAGGSSPSEGASLGYRPYWGRVVKCGRYLAVYCPDHPRAWSTGFVYLHQIELERKLGRLLTDDEVSHHKNEDTFDNSHDNLVVLTRSEHSKHHAKKKQMVELFCAECGKEFERRLGNEPAKKGYKSAFCSRSCNGKFQIRITRPIEKRWHA